MKTLLIPLIAVLAAPASAIPAEDSDVPAVEYSRFVEYTNENGLLNTIDLEKEAEDDILQEVTEDPSGINVYYLFTRKNPNQGQLLEINKVDSILSSNFNPDVQTVVLAHGWLGNQETGMNRLVREAYLQKIDANVIVLDWSRLARSGYIKAVRGVPNVGRALGRFLGVLNSVTGASYGNMHLVGFSLGAHLVGNAGKELNGRIARITGLDPAGPLWNFNSNKIGSGDAQYVEGIHTDGGLSVSLGIGYAIGDADFFPNGGNSQPGCFTSICHHNMAWRYFAASITYDHFVGTECSSYLQITLNRCRGGTLNMGNSDLTKTGSGKYRLRTRRKYPY